VAGLHLCIFYSSYAIDSTVQLRLFKNTTIVTMQVLNGEIQGTVQLNSSTLNALKMKIECKHFQGCVNRIRRRS